jgi:tRNA(fMet)-specific endonuclease VapC
MKIAFLLDSSACIPILRNKTGLEKLPNPAHTAVPVIVAAELWTGVMKVLRTHPQHQARLNAFLSFFQIIDFNMDAALEYADIRSSLEAAGSIIGPLDLLIAAQARSLNATLITGNSKEFLRVKDLKVLSLV